MIFFWNLHTYDAYIRKFLLNLCALATGTELYLSMDRV